MDRNMRLMALLYSLTVAWVGGWLAARFGVLAALGPTFILGLPPSLIAWALLVRRSCNKRDVLHLGILSVVSIAAVGFLTKQYVKARWDLAIALRRRVADEQDFIRQDQRFHAIRLEMKEWTYNGCGLYIRGEVHSQADRESLEELLRAIFRDQPRLEPESMSAYIHPSEVRVRDGR